MEGYLNSKSIISKDILTKWLHLSIKTETSKVFRIPEYDKTNNREYRVSLFQPYMLM